MKVNMNIDYEKLEKFAAMVRENIQLPIPVTLEGLTKSLVNIAIQCEPVDMGKDGVDATIEGSEKNTYVIYYDKGIPEIRAIFAIAHEVGVLFLHIMTTRTDRKPAPHFTIKEVMECNHFAADLLIPRKEFMEYYRTNRDEYARLDPQKAADYFHVEKHVMQIRGTVMGIWNNLDIFDKELYSCAVSVCTSIDCEDCIITKKKIEMRTEEEKENLHIPCVENLYRWMKAGNHLPQEDETLV